MHKRVLVTGASGFVGCAIVRALAQRRYVSVISTARNPAPSSSEGRDSERLDVTKVDEINRVLQRTRPHIVINAAAYGVRLGQNDIKNALSINTVGAVSMLEGAVEAGCERFIQLGTSAEYGDREGEVNEYLLPTPNSLYGSTKAAATLLVQERAITRGIDSVILRLFNIWGEFEPEHRLFPTLLSARATNEPIGLTDGEQMKDYSYVGDVADDIAAIALKKDNLNSKVVNVASGKCRPLREFVLELAEILDVVQLLRFGAKKNRADEPRNQIPDVSRLEELLPNRSTTSLASAIDQAVNHVAGARPRGSR